MLPVDFETWSFDLKEANKYEDQQPKWKRNHNLRTSLGISDLRPSAFKEVAESLLTNELVAKTVKGQSTLRKRDYEAPCNSTCRLDLFCQATSNNIDEWTSCKNEHSFDPIMAFENLVNHHWFKN